MLLTSEVGILAPSATEVTATAMEQRACAPGLLGKAPSNIVGRARRAR